MNTNYVVKLIGTYYNQEFLYEYDDYSDAYDMFKDRVLNSAEMISICLDHSASISLLNASGDVMKEVVIASIKGERAQF